MRKGKNRYIVEVNDWGCGLMIKDTQTGREIDAPDDEVITLCIKEMNSLAKELDTVRSVAEDNKRECEATRIENARLKAEVEELKFTLEEERQIMREDWAGLRCEKDRVQRALEYAEAHIERLTKAVMHSPAAQLKLKELEGKTTFDEINPDNQ